MIRVHSAIYRALWITVAVLGVLLLTMPLMLFSGDVHPHDPEAFRTQAIFSGLAGAATLSYSVWRLIIPLKARPRE